MNPLNIHIPSSRYHAMIGVGGIGTGTFVALRGNHTLGREESRAVRFLDYHDYCKLHIISHYVKTLLGPDFPVMLIGKVGDDLIGHHLISEMEATGLDVRYVEISRGLQTLNSVCFLYPDGTGGNLTMDDSACSTVDADTVIRVEAEFEQYRGRGIALAAPEVPLSARKQLLELGTSYNFLRAATFVTAEMEYVITSGILVHVDLLSVNLDEAAAIVAKSLENDPPIAIVETATQKLLDINSKLTFCITAGRNGSWSWDGKELTHIPAITIEVVSTAGAGDAFLASLIVGHVANLSLIEAQGLATLVAALSITSPHTIHPDINRQAIYTLATKRQLQLSQAQLSLLEK
jgi:ribokinase